MKFDSKIHHRRSIRLQGYDYSQAGAYFVTIVAWQREVLFVEIVNGEMDLNDYGKIVLNAWTDLPNHYHHAELGAFVIMPNHAHGIILLNDDCRGGSPISGGTFLPDESRAGVKPLPARPAPTTQSNRAMVCQKLFVHLNHFLRVELIIYEKLRESLSGSGIITNTSSATNPKWTGLPVTSNQTHPRGWMMMKTQIVFARNT